MAVEQKMILGLVPGYKGVYQNCVRSGVPEEGEFPGVTKDDRKHPLAGRIYRFQRRTTAEIIAESGLGSGSGDPNERPPNPFLAQVIGVNGKVVFKEIKPNSTNVVANGPKLPLYVAMYLKDVTGNTSLFYDLIDVTGMVVPPNTDERREDYLIRLKQFGRKPPAYTVRRVLQATSCIEYLTTCPMGMI